MRYIALVFCLLAASANAELMKLSFTFDEFETPVITSIDKEVEKVTGHLIYDTGATFDDNFDSSSYTCNRYYRQDFGSIRERRNYGPVSLDLYMEILFTDGTTVYLQEADPRSAFIRTYAQSGWPNTAVFVQADFYQVANFNNRSGTVNGFSFIFMVDPEICDLADITGEYAGRSPHLRFRNIIQGREYTGSIKLGDFSPIQASVAPYTPPTGSPVAAELQYIRDDLQTIEQKHNDIKNTLNEIEYKTTE